MSLAIQDGKNKPFQPLRISHFHSGNYLSQLICVTAKCTFTFRFLSVCYLPAQMKMYNILLLLILVSYGGYDTVQSLRRSPTYTHSASILRYRYVNLCSTCDGWKGASLKVGRNNKCSRWKTTEFLFRISSLLGVSCPQEKIY